MWIRFTRKGTRRFAATPSTSDGLLLSGSAQFAYVTLIIGSTLAIFAYPHAMTTMLAPSGAAKATQSALTSALQERSFSLSVLMLRAHSCPVMEMGASATTI